MEQYSLHSCSGIQLTKLVLCIAQLFPLNPGNLSLSGQGFGPQALSVYHGYTGKFCMYSNKTLPL